MFGAILGDIIGSRFERNNLKSKDFELFTDESRMTDDSILTLAVAHAYIHKQPYAQTIRDFALTNPEAGYGKSFRKWLEDPELKPYGSYGNGSAMRISALPYLISNLEDLLVEVEKSAICTHNHPDAITGASAIAYVCWASLEGFFKEEIKNAIEVIFGYNLNKTVAELVETYTFDVSCAGSVPEAIICFLESNSTIDAIRTAVSIGGDSDTIASMAGAMGEAYYNDLGETVFDILNRLKTANEKYEKTARNFIVARFEEFTAIKIK